MVPEFASWWLDLPTYLPTVLLLRFKEHVGDRSGDWLVDEHLDLQGGQIR
jgi:hypothetical protein